jgi:cytoskeletal protein CcmA (bactofilin family)
MFGKSKKPNLNAVNSIVAIGMEVEGTVTFNGTMKISGKVDGDIFEADGVNADSTVIIEGTVNGGTIEADNVVVTGSVSVKKVVAHKALIVISNGKIFADEIFYGTITSGYHNIVSFNSSTIDRTFNDDGAISIHAVRLENITIYLA